MRELERDPPASSATSRPVRLDAASPSGDGEPGPLAVIGAGRVGGSVALAAERAGIETRLAGREGTTEAARGAGAALLCVPDGEITAAAVAAVAADPPPPLVGHVSGAHDLSSLAPARAAGAQAFSMHPLQTIPAAGADLSGVPAAISGSSPEALEFARELATGLGMRPFEVADEHRAAYHAAASIASNFLVALEETAAELLAASGIEDARELLAPLVLSSAANWAELGPEALTGPIARGDEDTVARHHEALRERAPELLDLYTALAERTRVVAEGSR